MKVGISVICKVCGLSKKPRGRSAPLGMENSLCNWECPGYDQKPFSGSLWPGESEETFGYDVGDYGWEEIVWETTPKML